MWRTTRLLFPKPLTRSVLIKPTTRFIHPAPTEYNGIQSAAHHFKQQKHLPYFFEYLMWVVFGSEALHLIWLKMDYKEYKERTAHKTKLLEELIYRIENGETITNSLRQEIKMVLFNEKSHKLSSQQEDIDDDYLNKLIASSEQESIEIKKIQVVKDNENWVTTKEEKNKKPFFL